jgi:hypothetical protein
MNDDREAHPMPLDHFDEVRRLRAALDQAGYEPQRIAGLLRVDPRELSSFRTTRKNLSILLRRCAGDTPLDVFVRLFMLGATVDADAARSALAPSDPDVWITAGLLRPRDGGIAATLQLMAFEKQLLAVDPLWTTDLSPLHVAAVGWPSAFLAQMTVRRPARAALDIGTGSGVQAFLAAAHSGSVVGVDRNPRAVNLAAFNAQLNGLTNVTFLEGDLCSPVRDRRFDLIVANPPYVISPESRFVFRDSGLKGDEIAQRVLREGVPLLEEGGYLQMICEWAHLTGQDWRGRLSGWFEGTGCDVFVLKFTTVDSLQHADVWLASTLHDAPDTMPGRVQAWTDYYRAEGIESVSDGVITLRKRSGANNWLRFDDTPERIGPCGAAVERAFASADFLTTALDDEALLRTRLRLAPEAGLEQWLAPATNGWQPQRQQLFLRTGLAHRGDVDARCAALVSRLRGEKTLRQVLDDLARSDVPPIEQSDALTVVRSLVEQGFLLPERRE